MVCVENRAPTARRYAVPPLALFDCPVEHKVTDSNKNVAATLKDEARRNDIVIIATDNDREGENIGFEIIDICREGMPSTIQ